MQLQSVRKILALPPLHADPCLSTIYAPNMLPGEALYVMGGHIDNGPSQPFGSKQRFADRIWRSAAQFGSTDLQPSAANATFFVGWSEPKEVVNRLTFPWMQNPETWLQTHKESFVGSVASPSVVKIGNRYFMALAASIADPNVCCGEHGFDNVYGSCNYPWSFFVMYWATSNDGVNWTLQRDPWRVPAQLDASTSMALDNSALFYYPNADDRIVGVPGGPECKGVAGASMLYDKSFGAYFWIMLKFWGSAGEKTPMVRVPVDLTKDAGHNFDFQCYDTNYALWLTLKEGRLPRWLNDEKDRGQLFGPQGCAIAHTTKKQGFSFIATTDMGGGKFGVVYSNDLVTWPKSEDVSGPTGAVLNPSYFEDAAGGHFVWAQQAPGCVQRPFYGLEVWQADLL